MDNLQKMFTDMLDHIDDHKDAYMKPQWTNKRIVEVWIRINKVRLAKLGLSDEKNITDKND